MLIFPPPSTTTCTQRITAHMCAHTLVIPLTRTPDTLQPVWRLTLRRTMYTLTVYTRCVYIRVCMYAGTQYLQWQRASLSHSVCNGRINRRPFP